MSSVACVVIYMRIGAQKEAIAMFLSEYVLQDVDTLTDLARADRTWFGEVYAQFRRYIARLRGKLPNNRELVKLERLFAKAAKASNSPAPPQKSPATTSGAQYAFKGVHDDGRPIYESNFPKGTPKAAKSERILEYIQKVWSKKPIRLVITNGESSRMIEAQFDPTIDEKRNCPFRRQ